MTFPSPAAEDPGNAAPAAAPAGPAAPADVPVGTPGRGQLGSAMDAAVAAAVGPVAPAVPLDRAAANASERGGQSGEPGGDGWHGRLWLSFEATREGTVHQGGSTAPLRLQRGFRRAGGRCELPILHTAGGLVGGDRLSLQVSLAAGSSALLTSVAAQKVYGTVGRSRRDPAGLRAHQELSVTLGEGADLEWLPQELVLYADGLYSQRQSVELAPGASWLGAEVVRLGRTAAGESLGRGCWRSSLELVRTLAGGERRWELVDRLELSGAALAGEHGMAGLPVFGSWVWASPQPLPATTLAALLAAAREARAGLEGEMDCGALEQGMVARYRGASSGAARSWFTRLWALTRAQRGLPAPELPRCWPFQEEPLAEPWTSPASSLLPACPPPH